MTMSELAKLANVSVSTVSKAFSEADDINIDTKNRIFEIAKQTGCYGKFYKGKYHKKIIAVICPEIASDYYASILNCIRALADRSDAIMFIATDDFKQATQAELIEYFCAYLKVDGIIVFGLKSKLKKSYETPIVSLFGAVDEKVDSVKIDSYSAIKDAVDLLLDYGHTKIAFLGETLTKSKVKMFEKAMLKAGVSDIKIIESHERFEKAGKDGINQLMSTDEDYTAIICAYDNIAIGAIKELKTRGYKVPDDISVIGIDNIAIGEYTETALTTIGINPEEICAIAWDLLQKKLKNPYYKSYQNITLNTELIVRESVKNIKKSV